jgi:hypothetical protein
MVNIASAPRRPTIAPFPAIGRGSYDRQGQPVGDRHAGGRTTGYALLVALPEGYQPEQLVQPLLRPPPEST